MPTEILAKVSVGRVEEFKSGQPEEKFSENVGMSPVYSDSEENKTFSEATPNGSLNLSITNKNAWGFFVEGAEYYVKFTKVDVPVVTSEPSTQEAKT